MLAVLFAGENEFLLVDEPTNHLDAKARETVTKYLISKKGFILVSHDRDLLDAVVDHVLVLNRKTVEVQAGNFSSWWENKEKKDASQQAENARRLRPYLCHPHPGPSLTSQKRELLSSFRYRSFQNRPLHLCCRSPDPGTPIPAVTHLVLRL